MDNNNFENTPYDNTNSSINESYVSPFESDHAKKAKNGMILGIVNLVLNLIFCCIPFVSGWMFSPGWIFIALEIWGIRASNQGKQSSTKKGMAIAGLVMNIIALVWSVLMVILVLVLKFADIAN